MGDTLKEFFAALAAGFTLLNTKEANKYRDETLRLEKEYYDEKTSPDPNMAYLDYLEQRLCLLSRAFIASASGRQKT